MIAVVQERDGEDLDEDDASGDEQEWKDSGLLLKVESTELANSSI